MAQLKDMDYANGQISPAHQKVFTKSDVDTRKSKSHAEVQDKNTNMFFHKAKEKHEHGGRFLACEHISMMKYLK